MEGNELEGRVLYVVYQEEVKNAQVTQFKTHFENVLSPTSVPDLSRGDVTTITINCTCVR